MFIYTKHALEKMDALGISKTDIEKAITQGMKWKELHREMWHAQMGGIETVFGKEGENFIIITAYFAGRSS